MKSTSSAKKQAPFPFVLEELISIRPTVKRVFGFTHAYLDDRLLFSLRDSIDKPGSNGCGYTQIEARSFFGGKHSAPLTRSFI